MQEVDFLSGLAVSLKSCQYWKTGKHKWLFSTCGENKLQIQTFDGPVSGVPSLTNRLVWQVEPDHWACLSHVLQLIQINRGMNLTQARKKTQALLYNNHQIIVATSWFLCFLLRVRFSELLNAVELSREWHDRQLVEQLYGGIGLLLDTFPFTIGRR